MPSMDTITIAVDPEVAQAYRAANPDQKQKIQFLVNAWLKHTMGDRSLEDIIRDIQSQAAAQGLTQAVLDDILADE